MSKMNYCLYFCRVENLKTFVSKYLRMQLRALIFHKCPGGACPRTPLAYSGRKRPSTARLRRGHWIIKMVTFNLKIFGPPFSKILYPPLLHVGPLFGTYHMRSSIIQKNILKCSYKLFLATHSFQTTIAVVKNGQ